MSWKTVLYDYAYCKNQTEMDYSVEPLLPLVTDTRYLQHQISRLSRAAQSDRDRRLIRAQSETRLFIIRTSGSPRAITADVRLHRTSIGMIDAVSQQEQRLEGERLRLEEANGKWYVVHIEALDTERAASFPANQREGTGGDKDEFGPDFVPAPSRPYLNPTILPNVESTGRITAYNRNEVVRYAETWWDRANPAYIEFEVDCSNFVSQCLFAGGAPMNYTGKRDSGWWYKGRIHGRELWSFSWAVAHNLQAYMESGRSGLHAITVGQPDLLVPGDVISYDWNGDGRFQHSAVVTARDANGMPLVNAHTTNSRNRYWNYKDSPAWTERTRYRFLHVADQM